MSKKPLFCIFPWTHLFISNQGQQFPCCYAQSVDPEFKTGPQVQETQSVQELWNSDYLKSIRKSMMGGELHEACQVCRKEEAFHRKSFRETISADYSSKEERLMATDSDGHLNLPVNSLDLRLGNLCNLKCRMCHPTSSKKLIWEWLGSQDSVMVSIAEKQKKQTPWGSIEKIEKLFESPDLSLESLYFAGGEPFLSPLHTKIIQYLIKSGRSGEISIKYNTNLSIKPNIIPYLNEFKSVDINVSMDGYSQVNDYIRYPLKWSDFMAHFDDLIKTANTASNLQIGLSATVQAYNILSLDNLIEFASRLNYRNQFIVPSFSTVDYPRYFHPRALPKSLYEKAIKNIKKLLNKRFYQDSNAEELLQNRLNVLLTCLEGHDSEPELCKEFLEKTRFFDESRNQNVLKIVPDLSNHL